MTDRPTDEYDRSDSSDSERIRRIVDYQTGGQQRAWVRESSIRQVATRVGLSVTDIESALTKLLDDGTLAYREDEDGRDEYALADEVTTDG